ncbi:MAG: hypothetical protein AAB263_05745, partial [Planctomycetota bacterium]
MKLLNRVRFATATIGTDDIVVGPASKGFLSPAMAGGEDGDELPYFIEDGGRFAHGTGIFDAASGLIERPDTERSWNGTTYAEGKLVLSGLAFVHISADATHITELASGASIALAAREGALAASTAAEGFKSAAEGFAVSAALSASTAESAAGPTYASKALGEAATTAGQSFAVDNGDGTVTIWKRASGAAEFQRTLATADALSAPTGAELVGTADGGLQAELNARRQIVAPLLTAQSSPPASSQAVVETSGYAASNDGGRAPFIIAASEPPHPLKIQDSHGNWREVVFDDRVQARVAGLVRGSGDKTGRWNDLIAYLNSRGSANRAAYKMLGIDFGMIDEIDLRAGGVNPLLVSNCVFRGARDTRIRMQN